jgi:alpha-acetolactate decarboxylase
MKAKTVIDGKFWILENNGINVGILQKDETEKFVLSSKSEKNVFKDIKSIEKQFGKNFFISSKTETEETAQEIYGFPTNCKPHNPMYDVKKKLPLFTKSNASKSVYCAGYYAIKFDKGWVRSFCPKLITVQRYESKGPYKTEIELRQVLNNVNR